MGALMIDESVGILHVFVVYVLPILGLGVVTFPQVKINIIEGDGSTRYIDDRFWRGRESDGGRSHLSDGLGSIKVAIFELNVISYSRKGARKERGILRSTHIENIIFDFFDLPFKFGSAAV